jgi:hypothetical protein
VEPQQDPLPGPSHEGLGAIAAPPPERDATKDSPSGPTIGDKYRGQATNAGSRIPDDWVLPVGGMTEDKLDWWFHDGWWFAVESPSSDPPIAWGPHYSPPVGAPEWMAFAPPGGSPTTALSDGSRFPPSVSITTVPQGASGARVPVDASPIRVPVAAAESPVASPSPPSAPGGSTPTVGDRGAAADEGSAERSPRARKAKVACRELIKTVYESDRAVSLELRRVSDRKDREAARLASAQRLSTAGPWSAGCSGVGGPISRLGGGEGSGTRVRITPPRHVVPRCLEISGESSWDSQEVDRNNSAPSEESVWDSSDWDEGGADSKAVAEVARTQGAVPRRWAASQTLKYRPVSTMKERMI